MGGSAQIGVAKMVAKSAAGTVSNSKAKRAYVSQGDIPSCDLEEALRVPRAIAEHYAYKPTTPLNVAAAMDVQSGSGRFREVSGAAAAYGLTDGGAYADQISITALGMQIVRPTAEGDDILARREALLRPKVVGGFLRKYDGAPLPRTDIGTNVLIDMGVPQDRAAKALDFIVAGAESTGMIRTIKDRKYVEVGAPRTPAHGHDEADGVASEEFSPVAGFIPEEHDELDPSDVSLTVSAVGGQDQRLHRLGGSS